MPVCGMASGGTECEGSPLTVPILRKVSSGSSSNDHLPDIGSEDRGDARIGRRAIIECGSLLVTVDMRVVSR